MVTSTVYTITSATFTPINTLQCINAFMVKVIKHLQRLAQPNLSRLGTGQPTSSWDAITKRGSLLELSTHMPEPTSVHPCIEMPNVNIVSRLKLGYGSQQSIGKLSNILRRKSLSPCNGNVGLSCCNDQRESSRQEFHDFFSPVMMMFV